MTVCRRLLVLVSGSLAMLLGGVAVAAVEAVGRGCTPAAGAFVVAMLLSVVAARPYVLSVLLPLAASVFAARPRLVFHLLRAGRRLFADSRVQLVRATSCVCGGIRFVSLLLLRLPIRALAVVGVAVFSILLSRRRVLLRPLAAGVLVLVFSGPVFAAVDVLIAAPPFIVATGFSEYGPWGGIGTKLCELFMDRLGKALAIVAVIIGGLMWAFARSPRLPDSSSEPAWYCLLRRFSAGSWVPGVLRGVESAGCSIGSRPPGSDSSYFPSSLLTGPRGDPVRICPFPSCVASSACSFGLEPWGDCVLQVTDCRTRLWCRHGAVAH